MNRFPSGFTIGVVSPAGPVSKELCESGKAALEMLGAKVRLFPHVCSGETVRTYLAAPDEARAADLTEAWLDPEIDLILCARGGYGCARILPLLPWEKLRKVPKKVAGFSDITALHWAMNAMRAGSVFVSPMLRYFADGMDAESLSCFFSALHEKELSVTLPALCKGELHGPALPGNLTVAASLAGTPYFPDTTGQILFLEEVGERPYRIDRMLQQLLLAGAFRACAGVVFGNFTDCGELEEFFAVLADFAQKVACPVYAGYPFGHQLPFHAIPPVVRVQPR